MSLISNSHEDVCALVSAADCSVGPAGSVGTDESGFINEYFDIDENAVNCLHIAGNQFRITGSKIKVAGDNPEVGVFFVPLDDKSKAVKVTRIAVNSPSKIIGITPYTENRPSRLEIRTQYASSKKLFKKPRVIISSFTLKSVSW